MSAGGFERIRILLAVGFSHGDVVGSSSSLVHCSSSLMSIGLLRFNFFTWFPQRATFA